jgi:hypothetical protein
MKYRRNEKYILYTDQRRSHLQYNISKSRKIESSIVVEGSNAVLYELKVKYT